MTLTMTAREQTRAVPPTSRVHRADGVRVSWERYGDGEPTLLLLPAWSIIHSRQWKAQIPYLARHYQVVTFDGRGNGRSDRPSVAEAYDDAEYVADALAVLERPAPSGRCWSGCRGGAAGRSSWPRPGPSGSSARC